MSSSFASVVALILLFAIALPERCAVFSHSPKAATRFAGQTDRTPVYTYEVVKTFPHDRRAYTQGLVFHDGMLFESTGQHGASSLRKVELKSGKIKKKIALSREYFGEGLTILNGKIFQLTWTSGKAFVYDLKSFDRVNGFRYEGEGWGLTHDGRHLIKSDGTNELKFLDPETFTVVRRISVTENGLPVTYLNELEYIKGEIYANIWQSDRIARIDPVTGKIIAWIDLSGLRPAETLDETESVLNGIAYDPTHDRLFVTGKRWPKLFEIRLIQKYAQARPPFVQ